MVTLRKVVARARTRKMNSSALPGSLAKIRTDGSGARVKMSSSNLYIALARVMIIIVRKRRTHWIKA